jgi:hypothetical protein
MGDQSSYIDDFWLPEFKLNARYTDEAGFSNEMMVSTDYRTKLQSLTRRSKTKAKVIKPPFVFGNCFRLFRTHQQGVTLVARSSLFLHSHHQG